MKTTSYILLVGLIALLAFTTTQAQIIRVVEPVSFITAGRVYVTLANSAHDSSLGYSLPYNGTTYPGLEGAYPDSISIRWYASSDSTQRVFIRFKTASRYLQTAAGYTSVLIDSVKNASKAQTIGSKTLTSTYYAGKDYLGIGLVAAWQAESTGNATLTANASKIYVAIERYFHK